MMATSEPKNSDTKASLETCQRRVRAFIRKRLPAKYDVDDVMQEVLYQYVRVNSLMQPVEQTVAWMMKVARNEIIDLSRKKTEQLLPEHAEDERFFRGGLAEMMLGRAKSAEDEYLAALFWEELENALAELPKTQREAFEKTELQGYSFKQLSEITGIPVNTLLSRKHTAVLHLRMRLQDLYDEIMNT
jgi:RNA polymerase sigma factor (sigma-70 family)